MVVVEMREDAFDEVFELVDEVKKLDKKRRMVMCELEDAVYDCYEASKDDEYSESEDQYEDIDDLQKEERSDINLRRARNMRRAQMRNMRTHNNEYDNSEQAQNYHYHSNMRRRNRMGQYM